MKSVRLYEHFSAMELATEPAFIVWVKYPDEQSNAFWNEYINRYPEQRAPVEKARAIVGEMRMEQAEMDEARAAETWNRIEGKLKSLPAGTATVKLVAIRRWFLAAAVLLLVALGGYFFFSQSAEKAVATNSGKKQEQLYDVSPGGDHAMLTLADGKRIVLDSVANGALSQQGGTKVIKLGGLLSYSSEGGSTGVLYNTISTPRGGQYQLLLADGTKVWLNAASSLRFPTAFAGDERRVELTGEGYFEVAHKEANPFHVKVGEMDVQVLGTHFNVMAYGDESLIRTTLLEGKIRVKSNSGIALLTPGQQAQLSKTGAIAVDRDADTEEAVAWKNGLFHFKNADVETVMRALSRWYNVAVVYKGEVPEKRLTGKFYRNVSISQVLEILNHTGIRSSILPGEGGQQKIIITQ